jgi:hypothetical protein
MVYENRFSQSSLLPTLGDTYKGLRSARCIVYPSVRNYRYVFSEFQQYSTIQMPVCEHRTAVVIAKAYIYLDSVRRSINAGCFSIHVWRVSRFMHTRENGIRTREARSSGGWCCMTDVGFPCDELCIY